MKRREFIKVCSMAGGGMMLMIDASAADLNSAFATEEKAFLTDLLEIKPDGTVVFQCIKHEMGQGVCTTMAMIIADELCADWQKVKIEFPKADLQRFENEKNGGYGTGGSSTILSQWDTLRKAGATARNALVTAASRRWGISIEDCYAENHLVINRRNAEKFGFGELATEAAQVAAPADVEIKKPDQFTIIGRSTSSKLSKDIVTGQIRYGIDIQVPGMLYAVVARCPVYRGKLKSFDATEALKVKGVKRVFSTVPIAGLQTHTPYLPHDIREGVAVVADSFWAAKKGRDVLRIVWDEGPNAAFDSEDFQKLAAERARLKTDPTGYLGDDNAVSDLAKVRKTLRGSYTFPHQMHSCMEPINCTAHYQSEHCEIWAGSQSPHLIVKEVQRQFGLDEASIHLHLLPSGGGFERRAYTDMAIEAVFISRESGHIPVKMLWTREDDQQCNLAHHFQHMEYQAALDSDNCLYASSPLRFSNGSCLASDRWKMPAGAGSASPFIDRARSRGNS
jgi:CO/xanthine dehydrogenase Mo-binding subunit